MDISKLLERLNTHKNYNQYSGLISSVANIQKLKQSFVAREKIDNALASFMGIAISESQFMPDDMAVFTNSRNQIVAIMKFDGDKVSLTEVDPVDFYKPFMEQPCKD